MKTVNLGDKRLNERAKYLLDTFFNKPETSIPAACKGWDETKAAYRFFDNPKVTSDKIFESHVAATLQRIKQHPVVLMIQDTTVLNYSGQKERENAGPTTRNGTSGMFLHPTLAVTPERLCLGVVDSKHWARKELANKTHNERTAINHKKPIKQKETYRWIQGYQHINEISMQLPETKLVYVADRESDIYDLYQEAQNAFDGHSAHWLIRASKDRRLLDENGKLQRNKLIATVKQTGAHYETEFTLPARSKEPARNIKQAIYASQVTLTPPDRKQRTGDYVAVKTNVVIASETTPAEGQEPIEWIILTSLPIDSPENISSILAWYLCRWQIEVYFKILKSGCQIEKLQISNSERFSPCLALYMIVAWRILYMTQLGRMCPNISCECVFEKVEWETAYVVAHRRKPPATPPSLNEIIKLVASLGGFLNRKGDGEPGSKTLWIGMRCVYDSVKAREALVATYGFVFE